MPEAVIVSPARGPIGRGEGQLRVPVSSATGRIMALDSAVGSVLKHGIARFVEWLSVTCRHRDLSEHAIHPQGVKKRMFEQAGRVTNVVSHDTALEAEHVAEALWQAMQAGRLLVLRHPEVYDYYSATDNHRWLRGTMGLQQRLDATAAHA